MSGPQTILIVEDEPLIAMMIEDFLDVLGKRHGGTADSVVAALALIEAGGIDAAILDVNLRGGEKSFPIAAVLAELRLPYCVASSSDLERVKFSLELTGLAPSFGQRLYTAQMVKQGKPAPDLFLHAASAMAADPRRTLVIEDSVSGVTAAKAAGMKVWGFVGGAHYRLADGSALLRQAGADRIFAAMADFWMEG